MQSWVIDYILHKFRRRAARSSEHSVVINTNQKLFCLKGSLLFLVPENLTDAPSRQNTDCTTEEKNDAWIVYRIIFYAAAEYTCLVFVIL